MVSLRALFYAVRFRLRDLPLEVTFDSGINIKIDRSRKPLWKGNLLTFDPFKNWFSKFKIAVTENEIKITALKCEYWKDFLITLEQVADLVAKENLQDTGIWGNFPNPHATGFKEGTLPESTEYLKELYAEKFIVQEKKGFVIDLRRSYRTFLISADKEPKSFFDAAAQIGSLALGYNDPEKRGLVLHPEYFDWNLDTSKTEIYEAYKEFLRGASRMPHVYFFNSGAEANEAAIQLCLRKYPKRRKLLAFVGSFHGRSFLTLHLTHSPSKRLPFETFPDLVTFAPFPETKTPNEKRLTPPGWEQIWANPKDPAFESKLEKISTEEELLTEEIKSLKFIKSAFDKEPFLATIVEPRQCEGGDRYASERFYKALRALTKAYEVPLVLDEVQTGFGLGGPFFWHHNYEIIPDCITFAKKGQVAGVISTYSESLEETVNAASLHRGYLQAMSTLLNPPVDYPYVEKRLEQIRNLVGKDIISNPRGRAQNFAFDLPSDALLNKLISFRFEQGILFYPAGDRTARFRLLRNFTNDEIDGLFTALYKCFLKGADKKLIPPIPRLEKWFEAIGKTNVPLIDSHPLERKNPWLSLPSSMDAVKNTSSEQWKKIFTILLKEQRTCLTFESNKNLTIEKLSSLSLDQLIQLYKNSPTFTWMDLLWQCSRLLGWKIEKVANLKDLQAMEQPIVKLQKEIYEPARQTPFHDFEKCLESGMGMVLIAQVNSEPVGYCACDIVGDFSSTKLVDEDPLKNDPSVFYSVDITVKPNLVHCGLGLRLKAEQILELRAQNATGIRSRNRFPEAAKMTKLNHGFGSIVMKIGRKIYSDGGDAFYQALRIPKNPQTAWNPRHPSMMNKGSLANFVSPAYVDNLLFLKELLPPSYRHIYLASGRAEALDKAVKCCRHFRVKGKYMLSFEGDFFGKSTASTATLSGETAFFDWPRFSSNEALKEWIKKTPNEQILGCALEYKNNLNAIKERVEILRENKIPSIVRECRSAFWENPKHFVLSGAEYNPDIFYFGLGPQVAVVACQESMFVDKPLAVISTWDGDEHGLCVFQDHVVDRLRELTL